MIFSSPEFIVFFALVLLTISLLGPRNTQRKAFLLCASYYFYAYWDYRFVSLIIASTLVDFWVGGRLEQTASTVARRVLLCISLSFNLGMLFTFKYFNFFIDSFGVMIEGLGMHTGSLDIILPIGISFYTFQTLSYTIDIYNKKLSANKSLLNFALFVAFFPQLVAGPIERASHFLPQLDTAPKTTRHDLLEGARLFTYGLFKKIFLADRLALFVDPIFANPGMYDSPTTWLAALAYSLQIYFDFSGYSDMAIGAARMMGYDLRVNFNFPYLSRNVSEFWRRWHISLSTWVRDYLYIPLGGSRKGPKRTAINLAISMTLCGLWHGAAWTFTAWGALHGLALIINRYIPDAKQTTIRSILGWCATMLFVVVGWVLFRSPTFETAGKMLEQMFLPHDGLNWIAPFPLFVIAATSLLHLVEVKSNWMLSIYREFKWYTPAILFSLLWLSTIYAPQGFAPFIYFQF